MKRMILFAALLVAAAATAAAQSTSAWAEVEYSVGDDVVVIRAGRPLPVDELIGLKLAEGDQIQTGKGTFLELRLKPSGGVIKLSENTSFVLSSLSSSEKRGFKLLYGRMRAKVDKLASADSFNVYSGVATAGVRGTDFGYDVLTFKASSSESQKPSARIYCFNGSVAVSLAQAEPSKELLIKAGKMVKVEESGEALSSELSPISEEIREFWKQNDFAAPAALKAGSPGGGSGVIDLPSYAKVQAGMKVKNSAIFGGIVLVGLGSILQGVGAYAYSSGDPVLGLNAVAGGAFLGILALPVLVFGLSSNPVISGP